MSDKINIFIFFKFFSLDTGYAFSQIEPFDEIYRKSYQN